MVRVTRRSRRLVRRRDDRGAAMLITSLATVVMLIFAALGVDFTNAVQDRRRIQGAADAAALAAAQDAPTTATMAATAATYAAKNVGISSFGTGTACGTNTTCYTSGDYTLEIETPYTAGTGGSGPTYRTRVEVCHTQDAGFSQIIGNTTLQTCGEAKSAKVAPANSSSGNLCALCLLSTDQEALKSSGSGRLTVTGGSIIINSPSPTKAINISNSAGRIIATPAPPHAIKTVGGVTQAGPLNIQPAATTGSAAIADPLAALPAPNITGPIYGTTSSVYSGTLYPGIYPGRVTNGAHLTPGVYVFTNKDAFKLSSGPIVTGEEVMVYLTCTNYVGGQSTVPDAHCAANSSSAAGIAISAGTGLAFSPPTSGTYQGISIFADRNNTNSMVLTGSSSAEFKGTIYMKNATIEMSGSSGLPFRSVVVAGKITKSGSSSFDILFDALYNAPAVGGTSGTTEYYLTG